MYVNINKQWAYNHNIAEIETWHLLNEREQ